MRLRRPVCTAALCASSRFEEISSHGSCIFLDHIHASPNRSPRFLLCNIGSKVQLRKLFFFFFSLNLSHGRESRDNEVNGWRTEQTLFFSVWEMTLHQRHLVNVWSMSCKAAVLHGRGEEFSSLVPLKPQRMWLNFFGKNAERQTCLTMLLFFFQCNGLK